MTSTVLAQITEELSTNLASDRELHLIKSAHRIIEKNLSINTLTDRNDVYHRYVHRLMSITFVSLEKNSADVRLAAESYYEHILKAYECFGFPETSLKILAMSIDRMNGARQVTKVIKYLTYYLDILPKQRYPEKSGRTFHQEVVRTLLLRSLEINQTICHQAIEKSCDKLISAVIWQNSDLKEVGEKAMHKLWTTKGHASRTMAALEGAVMLEAKESFRPTFNAHVDKVIISFVNSQTIPVGAISLIKKCLGEYVDQISMESLKALTEMLLLMIRDSSNEIAYDAFAALEELVRVGTSKLQEFTPGSFLRSKYAADTPEESEIDKTSEFVDPLVNADLYEQMQETQLPKKVDLVLERFEKLSISPEASTEKYVAAFLAKTFLLTGMGNLLKTDRQSKDSMKILAIRVLNVISTKIPLEDQLVRVNEKTQCFLDIIDYANSQDDQLSQQAIKFAFVALERGRIVEDILGKFKTVKNPRYLLDAVNLEHLKHLIDSELMELLHIIALRPLLTSGMDVNTQDLTSSCRFMGVIKEWLVLNRKQQKFAKTLGKVEEFHEYLQRCILDNWEAPRFSASLQSILAVYDKKLMEEDQYPPSLPLRLNNLPRRHSSQNTASYLQSNVYDEWRGLIMNEAILPSSAKMMSVFRDGGSESSKLPQFGKLLWNSDTFSAVMQLMCHSLIDSPTKEESYAGFHVSMAVLNWIYRNVFIVRGAAETKEFPFLQHSRNELDDALGNRTEFRATLDAYFRTVQSSADEKLDQLLTPTINLLMASLSHDLKITTDNVLEMIVYIKILFTLSPVSAVKLLHILLRSLLDAKLVDALTTEKVIHYNGSPPTSRNTDIEIIAALQHKGEKSFTRWGDDVEIEKVKIGALTSEILEQLEPLITQSLKVFRYRGREEKEQVLQMMVCLMNHKLKLSDADPTECLMKYTVMSFARPEECPHPQLFDTMMHFLASSNIFQKEGSKYQKPIHAASNLLKSVEKLPDENVKFAMSAISFALMNGRYEPVDLERILETSDATWQHCIKKAPTETIYCLSLLLVKGENEEQVINEDIFWRIFSQWLDWEALNTEKVPFAAIAYPVSLISDYLTGKVEIFKIMDDWRDGGNVKGRCSLVAALYFCAREKASDEDWKRYFNFLWTHGKDTKPTQLLAIQSELFHDVHKAWEFDIDHELMDDNSNLLEDLMEKHTCGSYQDLCHTIVCLGESAIIDFLEVIELERPNDDSIWGLLVAEFKRLDEDLEHRLDVIFRLQDLVDVLIAKFDATSFLKLLANLGNSGITLTDLKIEHVKNLFDKVTPESSEDGYTLRAIQNLLSTPHISQLISEDELETAQLYMNLAEKLTGIQVTDTLIASYHKFRVDFNVKGEIDERKVKEIKKFAFSLFVLCQEVHRRSVKGLSKSQASCFRHPILNTIFNIPLVAMECFNWVPVIEIHRKPTLTCLPPTGHICDVMVLEDMGARLAKVGLVTNAQFEVLFTTMQAVIASTVIGPEKLDHDAKEVQEREARSCKALQLYIATILTSMKYPNGGDPSAGFVLKSPYLSELFLQSAEFAHLCNLKSVWKCEPRTAFSTPLERFEAKTWTDFDGKTSLYGICQTPLFSLWQLCGMMPIEFKQHANYHRIDHSASNYFLTSATNIDTISNVKQLMNIFEYWYSQGIGELSEQLLHSILHTILHLSDFFDDPDLHKAVLRTTSIIYKHAFDRNPFLSSFVIIMFLKSISVLGADMNGSEFKQGEPETIALKLVSFGVADDSKVVRIHTLAGLLYLVQSDSFESFAPTIDVLSAHLEKCLKSLANGSVRIDSDESQFVIALTIKLLEVPIRLKQDKQTLLKLLLAAMRVRRDRFIIELIAEGIEQLLCRSNEFNGTVTNFLLAGLEAHDPMPFPTDNEFYCRVVYRILMVAATRAKVDGDEIAMARIYKALQKLGFELLSRGETALAVTRTLPFFSICVNGVENTIVRYTEAFKVNGDERDLRFVTSLLTQIIETAATSKKWSVELKSVREKLAAKGEPLDPHNTWLLKILNAKMLD